MARALRIEFEGAFYHVTSRGNERKKIFFTMRDYKKFKEYLSLAREKFHFVLHCYALMSNHYHLLIETPESNLQRIMHYLNSSYTIYTNIKRNRSGHLFQGRYKSIIVNKDSYLLELSKYIHLNPVRAKMVERPEDYPHSSYRSYSCGVIDEIVSTGDILKAFGSTAAEAQAIYKSFVEAGIKEDVGSPLDSVYAGGFLGDEDFIRDVLDNLDDEELLEDEQIGNRKSLHRSMKAAALITSLEPKIEEFCKVTGGKRINRKKLVVYFLKKYSGATNNEIGALVGNISYSAAAKIYERFLQELEHDEDLKRQLQALEADLSIVKPRHHG